MAKANRDKIVETAEVLLDAITEAAGTWSRPEQIEQLARAFALVTQASPAAGNGRRAEAP